MSKSPVIIKSTSAADLFALVSARITAFFSSADSACSKDSCPIVVSSNTSSNSFRSGPSPSFLPPTPADALITGGLSNKTVLPLKIIKNTPRFYFNQGVCIYSLCSSPLFLLFYSFIVFIIEIKNGAATKADITYAIGCAASIPKTPINFGKIITSGIKNKPFCVQARKNALPVFPRL